MCAVEAWGRCPWRSRCCSWRANSASTGAAAVRGGWLASSCWTRRASCESGAWWACWTMRHCWVVALGGGQSLARLLRATAAGSTAVHAAAAMPRRPWLGVATRGRWSRRAAHSRGGRAVGERCTGGRSKTQCSRCGAIEWAGAGTRACFSSRGLQMLQAARWQIGSGYGAVRTCMSSNWIGSAWWMRARGTVAGAVGVAHTVERIVGLATSSHALSAGVQEAGD
jgi:hypothetical protein